MLSFSQITFTRLVLGQPQPNLIGSLCDRTISP